jgi:predicted naringenin-chalcone synthase
MYLHSLAHAVPPHAYSQADCWNLLNQRGQLESLRPSSVSLLRRVLLNPNSPIEKRHFALPDPEKYLSLSASELNHAFEKAAPALSVQALILALERADINAEQLDALFVCTCTGYICPGISSHIAGRMGLSPHIYLQDLVGLGCGAAIPTLRSAAGFAALHPQAHIACVMVEVCSAAFYLDDDPGVLISLCLFGDAASASIWRGQKCSKSDYHIGNFDTLHLPDKRECLRFGNRNGKLRNQLSPAVPEVAARAVESLWLRAGKPAKIISHTGGREVLVAVEKQLTIQPLQDSHSVLADYGNVSSPSVMISLEKQLQSQNTAPWLVAFGAGFAAHSAQLVREK